jgi:hypothetical protein
MSAPYERLAEQVALARELFPDAADVRPVWKSTSNTLDVGAEIREHGGRGWVRSFARRNGEAVMLGED